jgi:hypothetical protein
MLLIFSDVGIAMGESFNMFFVKLLMKPLIGYYNGDALNFPK